MTVRQNSLSAHHSMQGQDYSAKEAEVMEFFVDMETRLTRQEISDASLSIPGGYLPINSVTGRVNSLLLNHVLVEDGIRMGSHSGKKQAILRRFNPVLDKPDGDLQTQLRLAQGNLLLLDWDCLAITVSTGSIRRKYTSDDKALYKKLKELHRPVIKEEIDNLIHRLHVEMNLDMS